MNWSFIVFLLLVGVMVLFAFLRGFNYRHDSRTQHELDIRLTFKRYKELYPNATISYEQYKEMQKKQAFRRSISSRKLKRMVR